MDAVQRLQLLDPEKLIELCRMHLSFTLDLHDDEFSALLDFKSNKKKNRSYFGRLLKEKTVAQNMPLNQETISHIYQIIEFLGRDINVCKEGLFRKTGNIVRQQELKSLLRSGENIEFGSTLFTVHDCACVLKSFLAELPEPLLSEAHYSAHCQITDMYKENVPSSQQKVMYQKQVKSTQLLLLLLPPDNYCLLKYLLLLLSQIQNSQDKNKMTSCNLATLFAPHIICPRKMTAEALKENFPRLVKCITFLIDNATVLFEPPKELVQDVLLCLRDLPFEGQLQCLHKENEPVKTTITFCDRAKTTVTESSDYTSQALSDLQAYIENLPNTTKKRKLIKKFQKENPSDIPSEPSRKHFRSRSVGETLKRHLMKSSYKRRDEIGFRHSAFDVGHSVSKSTDSIPGSTKASSVEALCLEGKESSKFAELRKNFLRASRKKKVHKFVAVE
ncbi:rho GTPase-activating protein 19-like [Uloborus diversus]|uniref:rho GTPase-activating protein 19-like n=1 Tax=Uloborus diversus TaxID=327109 RepID=UPI0024098C4A|nr:rho GTPase-activating protein 19-like [Uloborus diversus]